jgi:hypothetical protein
MLVAGTAGDVMGDGAAAATFPGVVVVVLMMASGHVGEKCSSCKSAFRHLFVACP